MRGCQQFLDQNVLEHGEAVLAKYLVLLGETRQGRYPAGWRAPKWWTPEQGTCLAQAQANIQVMSNYLRYHDCGKPAAQILDEQGRSHFPGHAAHSARRWLEIGGNADEAWLMAHDMMLHTASAEECKALEGHPLAASLIFAALAELHANAEMFGGIETPSFKAKAKHLERRSNQLLRAVATPYRSTSTERAS